MTTDSDDAQNPWWDPLGVWQRTESALTGLGTDEGRAVPGSWNALQAAFDAVRSRMVGRPVAVGSGANRIAFTLTSLDATVGHMAAASGQVDDVSLTAKDVTWRSFRFTKVAVRLGNFHTRFRTRPVLVSAPVDVSAALTGEALDTVLAKLAPAYRCEITGNGDLRLRRARRPRWGYVQVSPSVEHGALVLRPTGLGRGERPWRLRRRLLPIRPRLNLPDWVRLTGADVQAGSLEVQFRIDQWIVDSAELMSVVKNS